MEADNLQKNSIGIPFQKGDDPRRNLAGRPKGQSLKEYWRQRFNEMSDEEKIAFTEKIGNAEIWRMAEGNPQTNTDITSNGKTIVLPATLINKNDTPPITGDSSTG